MESKRYIGYIPIMKNKAILVAFAAVVVCVGQANAYFDGGVGSLLVQYLVGCVAGLLIFAKYFKNGIREIWSHLFNKKKV